MALPPSAQVYLRPTQFVDTPVGRDGEVARLAGGLGWFAAYDVIAIADGQRLAPQSWPIAEFERRCAEVPQGEALRTIAARISAPRPALQLGERPVALRPIGVGHVHPVLRRIRRPAIDTAPAVPGSGTSGNCGAKKCAAGTDWAPRAAPSRA